jgi:transcription antitermination factor NusA-like protein
MKQLIEAIVHALVDKPDEIQIKEVIGEHAHVLELRVAKEDLGKVIGKGGAHWQREEALYPRDHRVLSSASLLFSPHS